MLDRFGKSEKPEEAHWAAWTCVLGADAVADWSGPLAAAERAAKSDTKSFQYQTTFGAVLYRAGRFDEAVQRLAEADRLLKEPSESQPTSPASAKRFSPASTIAESSTFASGV